MRELRTALLVLGAAAAAAGSGQRSAYSDRDCEDELQVRLPPATEPTTDTIDRLLATMSRLTVMMPSEEDIDLEPEIISLPDPLVPEIISPPEPLIPEVISPPESLMPEIINPPEPLMPDPSPGPAPQPGPHAGPEPSKLPCHMLTDVVNCVTFPPVYLGMDRFFLLYFVKEADGDREFLLKVRYLRHRDGTIEYMKQRHLVGSFEDIGFLFEVGHECDVQQALRSQVRNNKAHHYNGGERIPHCWSHNTYSIKAETPIYILEQYVGFKTLSFFFQEHVSSGTWTLSLMAQMAKQLVEYVDFVSTLRPPWVTHNLSPDSIVVNEHADNSNEPRLVVGDFLDAVSTDEKDAWCNRKTFAFFGYAPKEWGVPVETSEINCQATNFDKHYPHSFDSFSTSSILFYLITGKILPDLVNEVNLRFGDTKVSGEAVIAGKMPGDNALDYDFIDAVIADPRFAEVVRSLGQEGSHATQRLLEEAVRDDDFLGFLELVKKGLSSRPEERPLASQLLATSFLSHVQTPVEPKRIRKMGDFFWDRKVSQ